MAGQAYQQDLSIMASLLILQAYTGACTYATLIVFSLPPEGV